jgi:peptidoglycan/xylan/chitin deacetylase (PgdA/CDA1 family)
MKTDKIALIFAFLIQNLFFQNKMHLYSVYFTISVLLLINIYVISFSIQNVIGIEEITLPPPQQTGVNSSKVIVLAFDDSPKSQFTLAKPVLDKYGYKGSFFTVCNYVNEGSSGIDNSRMTWSNIALLQQQGHDIESHTMTHTNLDHKTPLNLDYEIGASKQCLLNHGINSTIFAYPASTGHANATVINVVSKYYNLARTGDAPLTFLHCNGYKKEDNNCLPFNNNGHLTYENRYDIRNWSDRPKLATNNIDEPIKTFDASNPITSTTNTSSENIFFNNQQMYNQFVNEVNLQSLYNKNECIQAIPIVVYHDFIIDKNHKYSPNQSFTDVGLFLAEMKYLHDNGFKVIPMSDLGYDEQSNHMYIKQQ